jgi:DNA primase
VARIAKSSIEAVVAAADMLDIVGQHTQLKKAGANYMGRCPFHEERTASFSVNPVEKLYYCFGCGEGGDLLGFVQKKDNLDFAQAVESLADRYGVSLEYEEAGPGDADRKRRDRLRKLLQQACSYYERVLWEARAAAAARAYLTTRGLAPEVCRAFHLGYSSPGWRTLSDAALAKGFRDRELLDAGLAVPGKGDKPYDRFRGRLMFPLADERGRVLGFGARTLGDEKPKYLNSPETPLYHKSEALFGLDRAKSAAVKNDRIFVVEGYTDVLALVQSGVDNVVASMGTAFTEAQLRRIARLTRNLYLCFDADAAGLGAMQRALELARRLGISMRVVRVPDGLDPADFVLGGHDAADFRELAAQAETLLQFRVRSVLSAHDLSGHDGRMRAFAMLRGVLKEAEGPLERDEEVRAIAGRLQLSEDNVRFLLSADAAGAGGQAAVSPATKTAPQAGERSGGERVLMGAHELEVRFLAGCLALPDKGRECLAAIDEGYFTSLETRRAYELVKQRLDATDAGKTQPDQERGRESGQRREDVTARDTHADGDTADAGVMAQVILRSAGESFSEWTLGGLFLRVQERHVSRVIARLKTTVARDDSVVDEARLTELQTTLHRIRQAIRRVRERGERVHRPAPGGRAAGAGHRRGAGARCRGQGAGVPGQRSHPRLAAGRRTHARPDRQHLHPAQRPRHRHHGRRRDRRRRP